MDYPPVMAGGGSRPLSGPRKGVRAACQWPPQRRYNVTLMVCIGSFTMTHDPDAAWRADLEAQFGKYQRAAEHSRRVDEERLVRMSANDTEPQYIPRQRSA